MHRTIDYDRSIRDMQKSIKSMEKEIKQLKLENTIYKIKNERIDKFGYIDDYTSDCEPVLIFDIFYDKTFNLEILEGYTKILEEYKTCGLYIRMNNIDKEGNKCILILNKKDEIIDKLYIN